MRRICLIASLVLVAVANGVLLDDFDASEWKKDIAAGYLPYRKLGYEDFPVSDGYPTPHLIHTAGFIHYTFRAKFGRRDGQVVAEIVQMCIRSGFDQNRSWKKTSFTEKKALLAHEQGHLDINELHAADFRKAALPEGIGSSSTAALDDLSAKLEAISDRCGVESRAEHEKYDEETEHGANAEKQKEWLDSIRKRFRDQGLNGTGKDQ